MPELPDVDVYVAALRERVEGRRLQTLRLESSFVLRTVEPPATALVGATVRGVERLGKRIVLAFDGDLFAVIHLMIAGRLRWLALGKPVPKRIELAVFEFENGALVFTEAGTKKRASLHVVRGRESLARHSRGGLEPIGASAAAFLAAVTRENRTLKRALTDPRLFSGIGNAYSDEILHRARLSPMRLTSALDANEVERLRVATNDVLVEWRERLDRERRGEFPEHVTAFRPEMAVHGKHGEPCPACAAPVQRIVYAANECNYCARCQNEGRLLADRALSKLLKSDWPKTLEELEELQGR